MFKKVPEKLSAFHDRIIAIEWRYFSPNPCRANKKWVQEFYANLSIVFFSDPVIRIHEKEVKFGVEQINDIYDLLNPNMGEFEAKICEPKSWMVEKLCPKKKVSWAPINRNILINDFTVEARVWLNIICSRVSPCTHMTEVIDL